MPAMGAFQTLFENILNFTLLTKQLKNQVEQIIR
jgi:hypothetical protein